MYTVKRTPQFDSWLAGLRDQTTKMRLIKRLTKAQLGNLGDVKSVGDGVMEMREFYGPGWRMYFIYRGKTLVVMLGGGDKSSQTSDIEAAKAVAAMLID